MYLPPQYTGDVNSTLENTNINVKNISFLTAGQKDKMNSVSTSGIDTLDFSDINQQVCMGTTTGQDGRLCKNIPVLLLVSG